MGGRQNDGSPREFFQLYLTSAWQKIVKLLILNDISSISQDEDLFDTVFRWPKSAKNGIFDEFPQNLRFLKIGEYH